jgi:uncharacterized membrane protein
MSLTWPVVLAVLFGALLHAAWNVLIKSSGDKALDTALMHLTASVAALPLMLWLGLPRALHHRKALAFAFANAALIALYTLADGRGVRASGEPLRYVMLLFVLNGVTYPALVWLRRDASARRAILAYARQRWPLATLGGSASIASYAIALWAMTRAPVASVAALRETSVLFAALLGTLLLKERFGLHRAVGTVVIVAGVMALRFA